jgi:hypothetical protein
VRQNTDPGHIKARAYECHSQESAARALIFWNLDELCPTLFQKTVFQYPVLAANLLNKGLKVLNISLRMFCYELL